jgi:hypothetical protein
MLYEVDAQYRLLGKRRAATFGAQVQTYVGLLHVRYRLSQPGLHAGNAVVL